MTEEMSCTGSSTDKIIREHFNTVYRLALAQAGNVSIAEDITQDVFLRFIQSNTEFVSDEHIKAWLIRVTINCAKSVFRSAWFRTSVPLKEELSFDIPEKSEVYFAVQDLPLKYRTAIHLFYYEDMNIKEIAQCTSSKESTVKSRLFRGRELLREKLKGGYDFV